MKRMMILLLLVLLLAGCGTTAEAEETVSFHGMTIPASDLSQETLEWLEWYNQMSEEDQLKISYIPAELWALLNDGAAMDGRTMETQGQEDQT